MPLIALIIGAVVLVHLLIGIGAGVIMDPHGPWRETFEVAAAGAGVVVVLLFLAILFAMFTHPTECTRTGCHDTDNAAAIQMVFLVVLMPPIYALASIHRPIAPDPSVSVTKMTS